MKNTKRARRRHHYARMKLKRQFNWGYGRKNRWVGITPENAGEINFMSAKTAGIITRTPKLCSCWMCTNPRRVRGQQNNNLTLQELKALDAFNDGMEELELK